MKIRQRFVSYTKCREWARSNKIRNVSQYFKIKKPKNFPQVPYFVYKNEGWISWRDFLGTRFVSYEECKKWVRSKKIQTITQYIKIKKPDNFPQSPQSVYKNEGWINWQDFLGKRYVSYEECKKWVRSNKIQSVLQYHKIKKPHNFPRNANSVYKNLGWTSWKDFLGTNLVSYEQCKKWVRLKKISKSSEYIKIKKPQYFPHYPNERYENTGWTTWKDFLATGFVSYEECKKWTRSKKIQHGLQYRKIKKPNNFPQNPHLAYKNEGWVSWGDFLGTAFISNIVLGREFKKKIQKILDDLEDNWKFYSRWTDGLIRNWFDREGLFSVRDPYIRSFFTNFIDLRNQVEGRKALLFWLKKRLFTESINGFSLDEKDVLIKYPVTNIPFINTERKKYSIISHDFATPSKILKEIETAQQSTSSFREFKLHVIYTTQLIWISIFDTESEKLEISKLKKIRKNGNRFHDTVLDTFLKEYNSVKLMSLSNNYIGKLKPTLMQLYIAHKMLKSSGFFNLSKIGVGKTLSAILASIVCDLKYTLIICPNNIVEQWKNILYESVKNCVVTTGKIPHKKIEGMKNYHVVNYDKFSYGSSLELIKNLLKQQFDFIVLDETQNIKVRELVYLTKRRVAIEKLIKKIRIRFSEIKILCLTATPVINNVKEGISLLELVVGKNHNFISSLTTLRSASQLHAEFIPNSIRHLQKFNIKEIGGRKFPITVHGYVPNDMTIEELEKTSWLGFEQFLLSAKIKVLKKHIKNKTIIYTEFVTGIVHKLKKILENDGYRVGLFTGFDKSGKDLFLEGKLDILIASSTLSEGIDKLQYVCSNIIFLSLPFTHARYEQVKGRLIRKNQRNKKVHVTVINGVLNGYEYDKKIKLNRIDFKFQLGRCVTEGVLPEKIRFPKGVMKKQIIAEIIRNRDSKIPTRKEAKLIEVR